MQAAKGFTGKDVFLAFDNAKACRFCKIKCQEVRHNSILYCSWCYNRMEPYQKSN